VNVSHLLLPDHPCQVGHAEKGFLLKPCSAKGK
jgi:hypothetical protein